MSQSEPALRRVFLFLAGFAAKHKLREALQPHLERRAQLAALLRNRDAVAVHGAAGVTGGGTAGGGAAGSAAGAVGAAAAAAAAAASAPALALTPALIEPEQRRLASEIATLQAHLEHVDRSGGGGSSSCGGAGGGAAGEVGGEQQPQVERKITAKDLQQALAYLGKHADKARAGSASHPACGAGAHHARARSRCARAACAHSSARPRPPAPPLPPWRRRRSRT